MWWVGLKFSQEGSMSILSECMNKVLKAVGCSAHKWVACCLVAAAKLLRT